MKFLLKFFERFSVRWKFYWNLIMLIFHATFIGTFPKHPYKILLNLFGMFHWDIQQWISTKVSETSNEICFQFFKETSINSIGNTSWNCQMNFSETFSEIPFKSAAKVSLRSTLDVSWNFCWNFLKLPMKFYLVISRSLINSNVGVPWNSHCTFPKLPMSCAPNLLTRLPLISLLMLHGTSIVIFPKLSVKFLLDLPGKFLDISWNSFETFWNFKRQFALILSRKYQLVIININVSRKFPWNFSKTLNEIFFESVKNVSWNFYWKVAKPPMKALNLLKKF